MCQIIGLIRRQIIEKNYSIWQRKELSATKATSRFSHLRSYHGQIGPISLCNFTLSTVFFRFVPDRLHSISKFEKGTARAEPSPLRLTLQMYFLKMLEHLQINCIELKNKSSISKIFVSPL